MNIRHFLLTEFPESPNIQQPTLSNLPEFDMTVTISIILAICALFAPSITAIINNRHNYKIRKLELKHDEYLHHSNIQYHNKYETYKNFIEAAGKYSMYNDYSRNYTEILSALQSTLLICDSETLPLLLNFQDYIKKFNSINREEYVQLLTAITKSLNRELTSLSRIQDNQIE